MKITIYKEDRYFTWELDGISIDVDFDQILNSKDWEVAKVISLTYQDNVGRKLKTQLTRNAFIDNIITHNAEMRDKAITGAYDYDKQEYILYRLLEGDTYQDIEADIANIERQRKALDDRKEEHKALEQQLIAEHVEKEKENKELYDQKMKVEELGFKLARETNEEKRAELQEELQLNMGLESFLREEHDLPAKPVIPELGFLVSEEMHKMINIALDPEITGVTLRNVTPQNAQRELDKLTASPV